MDFSADHYYRVSLERLNQASNLYLARETFALTMYVAGVSVESMLRAFIVRRTKEFVSRHDLAVLYSESELRQILVDRMTRRKWSNEKVEKQLTALETAINDVARLWHNNYRYASEDRLRSHLKRLGLYQKVKGDILKANTRKLLDAAD